MGPDGGAHTSAVEPRSREQRGPSKRPEGPQGHRGAARPE
jgi:hypothetical protein